MDYSEIITICQQLKSEQKEPTVALIKARMAGAKPLPMIIAGLKRWQSNPNAAVADLPNKVETARKNSIDERVADLEREVAELRAELLALKSTLTDL